MAQHYYWKRSQLHVAFGDPISLFAPTCIQFVQADRTTSDILERGIWYPSLRAQVGSVDPPPENYWVGARVQFCASFGPHAETTGQNPNSGSSLIIAEGVLKARWYQSPSVSTESYVIWEPEGDGIRSKGIRKGYGAGDYPTVVSNLYISDPTYSMDRSVYSGIECSAWMSGAVLFSSTVLAP